MSRFFGAGVKGEQEEGIKGKKQRDGQVEVDRGGQGGGEGGSS